MFLHLFYIFVELSYRPVLVAQVRLHALRFFFDTDKPYKTDE
jgi:hypothetical protein